MGGGSRTRPRFTANVQLGLRLAAAIMLLVATLTLRDGAGPAWARPASYLEWSNPPVTCWASRWRRRARRGRVFGIVSTGFNIGGIIGPILFGWLMDHGQPRWVFGGAVIFMALTALFGLLEERRGGRRPAAGRTLDRA